MIDQKVFIITGTSRGIGKQLAGHYLAAGNIVVGCSRNACDIEHKNYTHFIADIADEKEVVKLVRKTVQSYGKIDVLLNNAGIATMNHISLTPMSSVQKVFATNVFGSFLFLREVSKAMVRQKNGRIVNFLSVALPLRLEGEAIYAASKAAVQSLTDIAAREFAPFGITINAVGPTPVFTDLIKKVPRKKIESLLQRQAIKTLGTFPDIINVIDFFISEKSNFITGQTIYLGGVNQ